MRLHYNITFNSDIEKVRKVSQKIKCLLGSLFSEEDHELISLGLEEALFNAVEHGNFGITYEEKKKALTTGYYTKLLNQKTKENKDKKVHIAVGIESDKVVYTIKDYGKGFDWGVLLEKIQSNNLKADVNGRGVMMAYHIFDDISFNTKGNEVTLIKNLK